MTSLALKPSHCPGFDQMIENWRQERPGYEATSWPVMSVRLAQVSQEKNMAAHCTHAHFTTKANPTIMWSERNWGDKEASDENSPSVKSRTESVIYFNIQDSGYSIVL